MYHSHLLINSSSSVLGPSGGAWVRDSYRVHQRLCMAFKDESDPFIPHDLVEGSPHNTRRTETEGFLFRVDAVSGRSDRHVISVQSGVLPDWSRAFHAVPEYLAGPPRTSSFDPSKFEVGCKLRFRLRANPSIRMERRTTALRTDEERKAWLVQRAPHLGIDLVSLEVRDPGVWLLQKPGHRMTISVAQYEGVLHVTDAAKLANAIVCGVGRAKSFGLGLLSLVPVA